MLLPVSAIISQLFEAIMRAKYILNIPELSWSQRLRDKKTKLNICHNMLTSSTQLQNRSFFVKKKKLNLHVQSVQDYCFSSMQIFDVLVAVVVVPASAPWYIKPQQSGCLMSRTYCWCMHCTLCACAFHFDSLFCRPPHVCFFILFFLRPLHVRISFGLIFLPSSSRTFFIFNHFLPTWNNQIWFLFRGTSAHDDLNF